MDGFRFSNHFNTADLYLGFAGTEHSLGGQLLFTVAFLAPDAERPSYSLEEAWASEAGVLLVLGSPVQSPQIFVEAVRRLGLQPDERLVWIANPLEPGDRWVTARFRLSAAQQGERSLEADVRVPLTEDLEGYALDLTKGCVLGLEEEHRLVVRREGEAVLAFGRGDAVLPLDAGGLRVSFATSPGASFQFRFAIPGAGALVEWFDRLDIGLRYTFPQEEPGANGSVRFPVISSHSQHPPLTVDAVVMAGELTDARLTAFKASLDAQNDTVLASFFRTVDGRECRLETSSFVFGFAALPTGIAGRLTLVPEASFGLTVGPQVVTDRANDADDHHLACGASGAEYVRLPAGVTGYRLDLVPGMPAHAGGSTDAALGDLSTTAWVRISAPVALEYYAQPEGEATLFDATTPSGSANIPLLPYFPLIAGQIPPGESAPVLPMVPLAGVMYEERDRALDLEATAIAPQRKAVLAAARRAALGSGTTLPILPGTTRFDENDQTIAITPRGLEAGFTQTEAGQRWDFVQIARLHPPLNAGALRFAGEQGITEPLLSSLLTNQQFVVISNPDAIRPFFSGKDTEVSLGGWQFLLEPDTWAEHGTILIIKNAEAPLGQLALDPGSWTDAEAFNKVPAATSRTLRSIIEDAEAHVTAARAARAAQPGAAGGAIPDFEYFVDVVVNSPNWNGFLFLNAGIGTIPADLAGLRAGIDARRFFAHHLGVTQTQFKNLEDLRERETDMFGLVRYADARRSFSGGSYSFRVEELGVLFRNSLVRDFRSTIALYLGELFGQRPVLQGHEQPVARLDGVRQRRGEEDTYLFSTREEMIFRLGNGPLKEVDVIQGAFETVSVDPEPGGQTRARFLFGGTMSFRDVGPEPGQFDLFSFDKLAFSALAVELSFANDAPNAPVFTFTADGIQLSEALSEARNGSLFEGFPVKLDRIVTGHADTPGAQGYMTVGLPDVPVALPRKWNGLSLALDMGSLSDAAGAAGFEAALLVSWGPDAGQYHVGLKLPGSSNASTELSLLGVLKLSLYSLTLRRSGKVWALLMNGMTLSVFKKTLPPGGSFECYLFGNPDPTGSSNSLGWYGAYKKDKKKEPGVELAIEAASAPGPRLLPPSFPQPKPALRTRRRRIPKGE